MSSSKKVLFITPGLRKGGAETQLMRIANFLKEQGYNVKVIAFTPLNEFDNNGIDITNMCGWKKRPLKNTFKLYSEVKSYKPDVVIAFMFAAIIVARLLKIFLRFYLISSVRNSEIGGKWKFIFGITKNLDDEITYNALHSKLNFEKRNLVKIGGAVVPNGLVINKQANDNSISANPIFTWLCIAHFRNSKDYETLFKAIALIRSKAFIVNIIGNLYEQQWPFEYIRTCNIEDKVNILGFIENPEPYLQTSDAFVLSSKWEGSPNAMLEAMLNQRIIVGSDIGGIRELVNEANCGFLFEQGNERELANTMLNVMDMNKHDLELAGNNGRNYIIANFSEKTILKNWENIILKSFQK